MINEHSPPVGLEARRVDAYLVFLLALLSAATFFEGVDAAMLIVAAADVQRSLHISLAEWGVVFGITRVGVMASFFLLLFADRWGRRRLLLTTVAGFAAASFLTTFAADAVQFTIFQALGRTFLLAEAGLAVIVIGEEYPARLRGRAIAIVMSFGALGAMATAKLHPWVLLERCDPAAAGCLPPEGNTLHDSGAAFVAALQRLFGQPVDGADWRILYALGVVPLALVLLLRLGMRETRRFEAERAGRRPERQTFGAALAAALRDAGVPWRREHRRQTLVVALLVNCVQLQGAPALAFWVSHAREDLGFSPALVGDILFWGFAASVAGYFAGGALIDRFGRKAVAAFFFTFAAIAIVSVFRLPDVKAQYLGMTLALFASGAASTATQVYASEVFPTAIRATGFGWTMNFFGRLGDVGGPMIVSASIGSLGLSGAIALIASAPIVGAILVWRYAVETRALTLEDVQQAIERPQG